MLRRLCGQHIRSIRRRAPQCERHQSRLSVSDVTFRALTDLEIRRVTGIPVSLRIKRAVMRSRAVQRFSSSDRGSYSGIVGLPVFETAELLASVGRQCTRRSTECRRSDRWG